MKKLAVFLVLIIALSLALGACSRAAPAETVPDEGKPGFATATPFPAPERGVLPAPAARPPVAEKDAAAGAAPADLAAPQASADRLIIRTATLDAIVDDVPLTIEKVAQLAAQADGFVVSSKVFGQGKKTSGTISIRVAAERFDAVIKSLRGLAVRVLTEDVSSRDVSEEFVDLQSRLRNLEATEEQLLKLLERAATVNEVLTVQRELARVRGDIEQTKGRMQFLERSAQMSLINVNLQSAGLDAEFTADTTEARMGEEVRFSDQTFGGEPPYTYEWDFGDGAKSEVKNPLHAYDKAGAYTVSLRVKDSKGSADVETKKAFINVVKKPAWNLGRIFGDAARALVEVAKVLATIVAFALVFLPLWGGAAAIAWWVARRRKKRA